MMPYASLNAMASGVVLRRLLHQWEELVVAAGERADHEELGGEEREGVGRTDLHAELECRRRRRLGFDEPARHRRRERLGQADRPAQSWLPDGARRRPELREAASGRHMIGGFDRDVEGREMGAEFESRVAGCFGNRDRLRRDAGPHVRRSPAPTVPRAHPARCARATSDHDAASASSSAWCAAATRRSASGVQTRVWANSASSRA